MIRLASWLVLVLALALGHVALAEKSPSSEAPKEKPKTHQVTGKVAKVAEDHKSFVLTVHHGGDVNKQITIEITADTKFSDDGKPAKLEEVLKVGQKVNVTTNDAQPPVAIRIKAVNEEKEKEKKEQRKQEKEKAKQDKAPTTAPADKKE